MTGSGQRLNARTLAYARARAVPDYDRTGAPAIVHIGFGAFARAHLAVYADELLRRGQPALIRGVSLRSRRAQDQLEPQDGLFTVALREPGEHQSLQVIGALASMETGPGAALGAMADPSTKLVTLTITEKGYAEEPSQGPARDVSSHAPTLISLALRERRDRGVPAPVFASLDNLLDNGGVLRRRVLKTAEGIDPALAEWIARHVCFPNSVVDRMVPAPTDRDREEIGKELGLSDEAAVGAERHRSWVIGTVEELDFLGNVGVELVDDVAPFERRKLWLLNGPHSAVAYGGLLAGQHTIAGAVTDPAVARFVRGLVDQTLEVGEFPGAMQPRTFAEDALRRFANPALGHTCAQVGTDGSSKLSQRVLPVVEARRRRGLQTGMFAVVAAIWIAATAGLAVRGTPLPALEDPIAEELRSAARRVDQNTLCRIAFGDTAFALEVASMVPRLAADGLSLLEAAR
jgi:fructuronate reductase